MAGLPAVPVLSSGLIHASALKALADGGRRPLVRATFSRDAAGRIDLPALAAALRELAARPRSSWATPAT